MAESWSNFFFVSGQFTLFWRESWHAAKYAFFVLFLTSKTFVCAILVRFSISAGRSPTSWKLWAWNLWQSALFRTFRMVFSLPAHVNFWNSQLICSQEQKIFRSARTSWNTFVRPFVPRLKSKSHLKPYKSSQAHARPLIWNIVVKRTMSSIILWWRIQRQRQRQIQIQRQCA